MKQLMKNVLMKKTRFSKCLTKENQNKKCQIQRIFKSTNKNHRKSSMSSDSRASLKHHNDLMAKATKYTNLFKQLQQKNQKEIKELLTLRGHDCQIIVQLLRKLLQYLTEENRNSKLNEFAIQEKNNQIKSLKNQILQYHKLLQKKNQSISNLKNQRLKTINCTQDFSNQKRLISIYDSDSSCHDNNRASHISNLKNNKIKTGFSISKKLLFQSLQLNTSLSDPINDLAKNSQISLKKNQYCRSINDNRLTNEPPYKLQRKSHFISHQLQKLDVSNIKQDLSEMRPQLKLRNRMTVQTQNLNQQSIKSQNQSQGKKWSSIYKQSSKMSDSIYGDDVLKPIGENGSCHNGLQQGWPIERESESNNNTKQKLKNRLYNLIKPINQRILQDKNCTQNINKSSIGTNNNSSFSTVSIFKKNKKLC